MLDLLDKETLVKLAADKGVTVDKRWKKQRIVAALEKAKVKAPEKKGGAITEQLDNAPVQFSATIGRVYIRDPYIPKGEDFEVAGLILDFTSGTGNEDMITGGLSREFDPTLTEHDVDDNYCSCAVCLADVRDWIADDKHGLVQRYHIQQADHNPPKLPITGWNDVSPDDVVELHDRGFLVDLVNAARFERKHQNRANILAKLDELAEVPVEAAPADILTASIEVGA